MSKQFILDIEDELRVDLFAGGGGASTALEEAYGRHVDICINHDPEAVAMHRANHPQAEHFCESVWDVDPIAVTRGRPIGHLHASPDCTHFSQAKGGQPRDRKVRSLSWVVCKWLGKLAKRGQAPKMFTLENVEQILQWSPLVAKRCATTGRVITLDIDPTTGNNRVAAKGERVPVDRQFLVPCTKRKGQCWHRFTSVLRDLGYQLRWGTLVAANHGAPTTRERLFMVGRCDGLPLQWPAPSHARKPGKGLKPWRSAASCIDWSVPVPSIFERKRPLADATLTRVATGIKRYVLEAGEPFLVEIANWSRTRVDSLQEPVRTITAQPAGGSFAVVAPTLVQTGYGERKGQAPRALDLQQPLGTIVAGAGKHALCAAFLAQMNGGFNTTHARDLREPVSTITNTGSQQQLVAVTLAPEQEEGALRVAAFLMRYYGTGGQWSDLRDPAATITTRDRLALVTVMIKGQPFVIVDIGLRMLTPRELYTMQGFPSGYIIDWGIDEHGQRITLSKKAQTKMCGNSVSPHPLEALVRANKAMHHELRAAA
jgi:DNA (cytosine-5)-methyltransferase 1